VHLCVSRRGKIEVTICGGTAPEERCIRNLQYGGGADQVRSCERDRCSSERKHIQANGRAGESQLSFLFQGTIKRCWRADGATAQRAADWIQPAKECQAAVWAIGKRTISTKIRNVAAHSVAR
jgi:hypothetical protein